MKQKSQAMRICVGCGEFKAKRDLLRVVLQPTGEIMLDKTGKAAGRGAYVCPQASCLEAAYKAKRLERSLKHAVDPAVYESLKEALLDG